MWRREGHRCGPVREALKAFVVCCSDPLRVSRLLQKHYLEQREEEKRPVPLHAAVPQGGPAARRQKQRPPSDHHFRYFCHEEKRGGGGGRGKEQKRDSTEFKPKSLTESRKMGREGTWVLISVELAGRTQGIPTGALAPQAWRSCPSSVLLPVSSLAHLIPRS